MLLTNTAINLSLSHLSFDSSSSRNTLSPLVKAKHLTVMLKELVCCYFLERGIKVTKINDFSKYNLYLKFEKGFPKLDFKTDHSDVVGFPFSSEHLLSGDVLEHEKHSKTSLAWLLQVSWQLRG